VGGFLFGLFASLLLLPGKSRVLPIVGLIGVIALFVISGVVVFVTD